LIKRIAKLLLLLILLATGLLAYTFYPRDLEIDPSASAGIGRNRRPLSDLPDGVSFSIVRAGKMPSRQMFSYRGGSPTGPYENGMIAVLVRHSEEMIVLDTGFGSKVDEQWKTIPALMRNLSSIQKEATLKDQLTANGIPAESLRRAFITHSHWDHISGLEDFPSIEVWMPGDELAFIRSGAYPGLADQIIDRLHVNTLSFKDGPYENFESSHDLYDDGSVVMVPLPGHTPGSLGMFVNLKSGKRFLFIG
jgi:glyoxylase-like metal-dependent hydrolase (beta-lactamase superfamily II)